MFTAQYKVFSENVHYAARVLHYTLHLDQAASDSNTLSVLNDGARFWTDFRYMSVQTVFITLGKVFSADGRGKEVFSFRKLLNAIGRETDNFSRAALRKRKEGSLDPDMLEDYLSQANEWSVEDYKIIREYSERAHKIWEILKPARDKLYAHNEMISEEEKTALLQSIKYSDLEEIVQVLVNICHQIEMARDNGRKPDFSYHFSGPMNVAKGVFARVLNTLKQGFQIV